MPWKKRNRDHLGVEHGGRSRGAVDVLHLGDDVSPGQGELSGPLDTVLTAFGSREVDLDVADNRVAGKVRDNDSERPFSHASSSVSGCRAVAAAVDGRGTC
jgi:hypothetical protein